MDKIAEERIGAGGEGEGEAHRLALDFHGVFGVVGGVYL